MLLWWDEWSPDRRSSVRLSSGAFLLVSPRVFRHQTRHHHLFLHMRTTSCQGSQIDIVTRLHTSISCTLCLVHPLSLPHWRSRCDSFEAYTTYYEHIYVAILTYLPTCLSCLSPCQLFYHSIKQNVCPYYSVAVNTARDIYTDRFYPPGHFMIYSPISPTFERQNLRNN